MTLEETLRKIKPVNEAAIEETKKRWSTIAHPLNSLGLLEADIIKIAGITGSDRIDLSKKALVVMCADNGVVAEGVTQAPSSITALVADNLTHNDTCATNMCQVVGARVIPVDIGVEVDLDIPGLLNKKIAYGTKNMVNEPAMTREQAVAALEVGINLIGELKEQGYNLIATGEMGIGNTTTSSAVTAVLLDRPVEEVTGRGAGLSSEGLERKIKAIKKAIAVNKPDPRDGLDTLAKVGGLDIAGMAGLFLGGALYGVPVLIDGFISAAAALVALRICPQLQGYLLATHVSKEPAGRMMLEALDVKPLLCAEMCMGEGTGAVAAMPVLDMAAAVYNNMGTFSDISMEAYKPLS